MRLLVSVVIAVFAMVSGPSVGQTTAVNSEFVQQPPPEFIARLEASKTLKENPWDPIFRAQYVEFAQKNPFAHKALVLAAEGRYEESSRFLSEFKAGKRQELIASFMPDVSISFGLSASGKVGDTGLEVSAGPSFSASLDGGDIFRAVDNSLRRPEEGQIRFQMTTNPGEIDAVVGMLRYNADPSVVQLPTREKSIITAVVDLDAKLPAYSKSVVDQMSQFSEGGAADFNAKLDIEKKVAALSAEKQARFNSANTTPEERLGLLEIDRDEFQKAAEGVFLSGKLAEPWPSDVQIGDRIKEFEAEYFTPSELQQQQHQKRLDEFDAAILSFQTAKATATTAQDREKAQAAIEKVRGNKEKYENAFEYSRFQESMQSARQELQGIGEIIALFDAEFASEFVQKGTGVANIVEGVARMYYGDYSFSSAGQIATGIQQVFKKQGPSADEVLNAKLDVILRNQAIMLEILLKIDKKINFIATQVSLLRTEMQKGFIVQQEKLRDLTEQVERVRKALDEQTDLLNASFRNARETELIAAYSGAVAIFEDRSLLGLKAALRLYVASGGLAAAKDPPTAWLTFNNAREQIATAVVKDSLTNPNVMVPSNLGTIADAQGLMRALTLAPQARITSLPGILNEVKDTRRLNQDWSMGNPIFMSEFTLRYADLMRRLPMLPNGFQRDEIPKICAVNQDVAATTDDLVRALPLYWAFWSESVRQAKKDVRHGIAAAMPVESYFDTIVRSFLEGHVRMWRGPDDVAPLSFWQTQFTQPSGSLASRIEAIKEDVTSRIPELKKEQGEGGTFFHTVTAPLAAGAVGRVSFLKSIVRDDFKTIDFEREAFAALDAIGDAQLLSLLRATGILNVIDIDPMMAELERARRACEPRPVKGQAFEPRDEPCPAADAVRAAMDSRTTIETWRQISAVSAFSSESGWDRTPLYKKAKEFMPGNADITLGNQNTGSRELVFETWETDLAKNYTRLPARYEPALKEVSTVLAEGKAILKAQLRDDILWLQERTEPMDFTNVVTTLSQRFAGLDTVARIGLGACLAETDDGTRLANYLVNERTDILLPIWQHIRPMGSGTDILTTANALLDYLDKLLVETEPSLSFDLGQCTPGLGRQAESRASLTFLFSLRPDLMKDQCKFPVSDRSLPPPG